MKVSLIDFTGAGSHDPADYAACKLIFAKNTRVNMSPNGFKEIQDWSKEKKFSELEYIANTIPGSHEFVDYTFMLEGVTRAFTHQLVRTRTASYAQQSQQIMNFSEGPGWTYETGKSIADDPIKKATYDLTMAYVAQSYKDLIAAGATVEDARGLLPTNIHTNIVVKMNLRTLSDLFHSRISPRNLGEFREVCVKMKQAMLEVHPWVSVFLNRTLEIVTADLDEELLELRTREPEKATKMLKLVDQLRRKG